MGRIVISMAGEGRGHAARARALAEALRGEHEISLFASRDAHDLLAPLFEGSEIPVHRTEGLFFHYDARGRVSPIQTGLHGLGFARRLPSMVRALATRLRELRPDLVITDFEPLLPRAAERLGIPYLSVSHQRFLVHTDLSALPADLRRHARLMSLVVHAYHRRQVASVVSSFFPARSRRPEPEVVHVGPLLREQVHRHAPRLGEHLLAYFRREIPPSVLQDLVRSPFPIRVYGLGSRPARGAVSFHAVDEHGFLSDLASCQGVLCTAGNQLVGEALHFRKPVLAMPEPNNQEQRINGWLLQHHGWGLCRPLHELRPSLLLEFHRQLPLLRARSAEAPRDGLPRTLEVIGSLLPSPPALRAASSRESDRHALATGS